MIYLDLDQNVVLKYEPPREGAMIGSVPKVNHIRELDKYLKSCSELLLDTHFTIDAHDCNNLTFLKYIKDHISMYGTVEVEDDITTLHTEELFSAIYIQCSGHQQFRCSGLDLLLKIHNDFKNVNICDY